jgi:hypothetical protein
MDVFVVILLVSAALAVLALALGTAFHWRVELPGIVSQFTAKRRAGKPSPGSATVTGSEAGRDISARGQTTRVSESTAGRDINAEADSASDEDR